ncbi:hypothetical protein BHE97_02065 [Aeromicrobium sp. PE09-221]|uniref:hypothetical protein n=1 Tax=Aeromicrobium sp. PE09-221 TaxID=1898043 RepID=UPI000B3ED4B7|nr:hypothetical protein [Aeromicrobium sp. PE09-221]OUZ12512.1 hypothetical protein BHE97_02065 [Aeromicrobium sp. PE09-221]
MSRFLAILNGAADDESMSEFSDDQQAGFMAAWAAWAQANESALVDPGAPLFRKKMVTQAGVEDFTDSKVAYAIVEAGSHDEAARIFSAHPHLTLDEGNAIEVLECPPLQ